MEKKAEMEAKKEFLNTYLKAKSDVARLEEQLKELKLNKISIKAVIDGMPRGSGHSDLSGYMAKVDQLEREIISKRYGRIIAFQKVQQRIEEMEDEQEKMLLTYRYLRGFKWEDIAEEMNYSWQHLHKIHNKALGNFTVR